MLATSLHCYLPFYTMIHGKSQYLEGVLFTQNNGALWSWTSLWKSYSLQTFWMWYLFGSKQNYPKGNSIRYGNCVPRVNLQKVWFIHRQLCSYILHEIIIYIYILLYNLIRRFNDQLSSPNPSIMVRSCVRQRGGGGKERVREREEKYLRAGRKVKMLMTRERSLHIFPSFLPQGYYL